MAMRCGRGGQRLELRASCFAGQVHKIGEDSKRQRISSITPDAPAVAATCNAPLVQTGQPIAGATPECLDRLSAVASAEDMRSLHTECQGVNQLSAETERLSTSEDPDSSPESCFDSAFIPAGSVGDLQAVSKRAAPLSKVPPAPTLAPAHAQHQLRGGKIYRFGSIRSRSRLSVTDSGTMPPPSLPEALVSIALGQRAAPYLPQPSCLDEAPRTEHAPCTRQPQQQQGQLESTQQAAPVVAQTGNPTMAVANLVAGHTLARLPPAELALLIANHNGSDPALTQALQCAMSALSDAQLGNVGCAPF